MLANSIFIDEVFVKINGKQHYLEQQAWVSSFDRELSAVNLFSIRDEITSAITNKCRRCYRPQNRPCRRLTRLSRSIRILHWAGWALPIPFLCCPSLHRSSLSFKAVAEDTADIPELSEDRTIYGVRSALAVPANGYATACTTDTR